MRVILDIIRKFKILFFDILYLHMRIEELKSFTREKSNYDKNGFCFINNFVDQNGIDNLIKYLNEIVDYLVINGDEGSYINYANKEKKIVNSVHRLEEIKHQGLTDLIKRYNFESLADYLIGEKCTLFSIQAFLKPPGIGLRTPAHQDNAYWCHDGNGGLTIWVSFDKAGKFNGMMKYAINSNKNLMTHLSSQDTPGSSLIIPESELRSFQWSQPEMNPGDIAIHDGLVIHCSELNKSDKPRRGFLLNYRSTKCKRNLNKYEIYLKNLEKINKRS